jgi:hypothetical protein
MPKGTDRIMVRQVKSNDIPKITFTAFTSYVASTLEKFLSPSDLNIHKMHSDHGISEWSFGGLIRERFRLCHALPHLLRRLLAMHISPGLGTTKAQGCKSHPGKQLGSRS